MIDVVVIAAEPEVREGLQRLLEVEGDIRVVSALPDLEGRVRALPTGSVVVMAPGIRLRLAGWEMLLGPEFHGVVVLTAVPGWRRYPAPVVQVPMELRGERLRGAVRRQARRFGPTPPPPEGPSPLDEEIPLARR